jgi:tetratricopeptide (TPR) repeat protein
MIDFKKVLLFASLLFSCYLFLNCTAPIWQRVDLAKRQGDLRSAEEQLETYLRSHPKDAKAYYTLGEIRAEMSKWNEMLEAFAQSEAVDKSWKRETKAAREYHWTKNLNIGLEAFRQQEYLKALNRFRNATLILPGLALAHRLRGEASLALGDTTQAQASFLRTLELDENDNRARRFLLAFYFSTGNYWSAIQEAEILLQEFPNDSESLRIRAYSYDRLNEKQLAMDAYRQLLNVSKNAMDLESYAAFQYRNGGYEAAIQLSRRAIQYGGNRLQNLKAIAQCQLMQQNFDDLGETAREILEIKNNDLAALQLLRLAYAALGKIDDAETINEQIKQSVQK